MRKINALIIVTSHSELGDTGKKTGFYYDELAIPYWKMVDAGFEVEIASIKGGSAPVDPNSLKSPNEQSSSVKRFLNDKDSLAKIKNTLAVNEIDVYDWKVIFLAGGHGTMWDFSQSNELARLITKSYENGAFIGAVCHGVAGLLSARMTSDGSALIEKVKINSFTAKEEQATGLDTVVPYILETELRKLGAIFKCTDNFEPYVVNDKRIITGQNPASSSLVADELVKSIKE